MQLWLRSFPIRKVSLDLLVQLGLSQAPENRLSDGGILSVFSSTIQTGGESILGYPSKGRGVHRSQLFSGGGCSRGIRCFACQSLLIDD